MAAGQAPAGALIARAQDASFLDGDGRLCRQTSAGMVLVNATPAPFNDPAR